MSENFTDIDAHSMGVSEYGNVSFSTLSLDPISSALASVHKELSNFSMSSSAFDDIYRVYNNADPNKVHARIKDWSYGIFADIAEIIILDDGEINGTQSVSLQILWQDSEKATLTGLKKVLLEEYGHQLDAEFNPGNDTPGDEGEFFSLIILGSEITEPELMRLRIENDASSVFLNGKEKLRETSDLAYSVIGLILAWRWASGQNVLWFMGGNNNSRHQQAPLYHAVLWSWDIKGIADFNGDDRPDLLWRDGASGQNVLWFMGGNNNTQIMSSASLTTVGGSWDIKGIADFNGDDRPDLLWRDGASGQNVLWFMGGNNNTQIMSSASLTTVGGSWDIKGIADFNGDDRPDLIWRDGASGQNVLWFMGGTNNTQIMSSASLTTVGGSWDIKGIADFNGDDRPDLLWRDGASGQNVLWFMGGTNNTQIMSSASLTTVGGSWNPILPGWGAGQIGATPVITVSATDANAAETVSGNLPNPGVFTFTRTGSTVASLTVNFGVGGTAISGTDYTALPTSVTFAPDSSTATVTISPIDDQIYEGDETVFFVLLDNAAYAVGPADSATVTITDNESLLTPGEPDNYQPAPINPVALSQDPQINALLSGYKWTKTALTYSFSNLSITTINNIRKILE